MAKQTKKLKKELNSTESSQTVVVATLLMSYNSRITDGKFSGIGRGKVVDRIPTPQALTRDFLPKHYDKTKVELKENQNLVLYDFQAWLAPYGPKELKLHSLQLDFLITVEDGQAILKSRCLSGGSLPWVGRIVILRQIPPGSPEIIDRIPFKPSFIQSFLNCHRQYLIPPEISEWEQFLNFVPGPPESHQNQNGTQT